MPAIGGGSVEVARSIQDQTACWDIPIAASEGVQYLLLPGAVRSRRQLENRTAGIAKAVVISASCRGAVEIPTSIAGQPSVGIKPVREVEVEVVQYLLRPASALLAQQFEDYPQL